MKTAEQPIIIDVVTVEDGDQKKTMFDICIAHQDVPLIGLEELRELHRLAGNYIRLAESLNAQSVRVNNQ